MKTRAAVAFEAKKPLEIVEHGAERLVQVYLAEFVPAQGPTVFF
jgi:hypothetical protein